MNSLFKSLLLCGAFFATAVTAYGQIGFVELARGEKTYINYQPAAPGKPTLVLLNGLTYSLQHWNAYADALHQLDPGIGILRYDMKGMGATLLQGHLPVNYEIPFTSQVAQLQLLLDHLGLQKVHVAGLSYGGAIAIAFGARHPERIASLVLLAPFTEPLQGMDQWIRNQITVTRLTFPWNPASDDELYDFFLRQFIYTAYPSLEPVVLENPYKLEAIFRMVQGIRHYKTLQDARLLPAGSVHLLLGAQDQYIERPVLDRFWRAVPAHARASRIDVDGSEHKIPESVPAYAASWTLEILRGRSELSGDKTFAGSARDFTATSGPLTLRLRRP